MHFAGRILHFVVAMLVCYLFKNILSQIHTTRNGTLGVALLFFAPTFVVMIPPYEQLPSILRAGVVLLIPLSAAVIGACKQSYSVGLTANLLATLAYIWADRLFILYAAFVAPDNLVPPPFQMHDLLASLCFLAITSPITAIGTFVAIRKRT